MTYSVDNPPALVNQMVGKNGGSTWLYDSADAATTVRVTGYITNGEDLGMKVGDQVQQIDSAGATVAHLYTVKSIHATNGSVDLTDGLAIPVTDSD